MKYPLVLFSMAILLGSLTNSHAQIKTINLIDESNREAIAGASYHYGEQTGISDAEGLITLDFNQHDSLYLSHLNYGEWILTPDEVRQSYSLGTILKLPEYKEIHPAMVIALHSKTGNTKIVSMNSHDKLSHDGGVLLAKTPVINGIRKSGNYGFDPVMRGFKYDQLNIVIDGTQCAMAACPNRMDPPTSQISPNMMSRVEILKGPHSLRYGNSFGGTINFVSIKPSFTEKKSNYGRLSGAYESNGNIMRTEGLVGVSGDKYNLGVFGSFSEGEDYKDGEGQVVPSDFKRGSLGAKLGLKISDKQQLSLSATRNIARDVIFPALPMDLRNDDTWLFNASHDLELDHENLKSWNINIFGTIVDHFMDNRLKALDPRMMDAATSAKTYSYGGRTEGIWLFSKSKLYAGIDLRIEEAKGTRIREFLMGPMNGNRVTDNAWQHAKISNTGLFSEYHFSVYSIEMIASGRLEMNVARLKDPDPEFSAIYPESDISQYNTAISIGGVKSLFKDISIGLWLGRSMRSPCITERYINSFPVGIDPYEMLGNPELDQEINNQVDLIFGFKKPGINIEVGLFSSYLQDYISSEIDTSFTPIINNSPGVRQYRNIGAAMINGFEVSWGQSLIAGLQHQLSLAYSHGTNLDDNNPLPEIAPLDIRYSLSGNYFNEKFQPEASIRYVAQQERISTTFGETETPSFILLDLRLSYQITEKISASAAVLNLLDETYFEHLSRSVRGTQRAIHAAGGSINFSITYDFR